jgi:hypothetical protein
MNSAIKERPIWFSGPMVRAILDGSKTQMRNPVKNSGDMEFDNNDPYFGLYWNSYIAGDATGEDAKVRCPYGIPGERLWARETWYQGQGPTWGSNCVVYEVDNLFSWKPGSGFDNFDLSQFKKRPSTQMPRWASRILLEITDVRVQRLQEISEEDARAEGVIGALNDSIGDNWCAREAFAAFWESINGPNSWHANSWVWAITFRRIAP